MMPRFVATFWIFALCFLSGSGAARADAWETLTGCCLLENGYFDGDSFHVKAGGQDRIFRLYAVDAPETNDDFAGRVDEQKKYFGTTKKKILAGGQEAAEFTKQLLQEPFTVETKWVDARGNSRQPRFFARITLSDGSDLGLRLIDAGLARSYGMREDLSAAYLRQLDKAQEEAKEKGLGLWAARAEKAEKAGRGSGKKGPTRSGGR